VPSGCDCGRCGQVPNEEVPYHEHNVQDVMIEDLQRQVAELTQRLAAQNMEMHCNIDNCNLDFNCENLYHNFVLGREQHGQDEQYRDLDFRVELSEFFGVVTALIVVNKSQAYLPNPSQVEDEIIEEYFSVDWVSPPIYDIYLDEENLLDEVNLFIDTITIVEDNDVHSLFDEKSKSEISQWGLEKINYVDFLGIGNFPTNFPKTNLDVSFGMLEENLIFCGQERIDHFLKIFMGSEFMTINQELAKIILSQVGARKFRSTTKNKVVMGCKLFLFRHQVILVLRSTRWN